MSMKVILQTEILTKYIFAFRIESHHFSEIRICIRLLIGEKNVKRACLESNWENNQ
jgi:hypothetical protein